jgi:hypothetical protein
MAVLFSRPKAFDSTPNCTEPLAAEARSFLQARLSGGSRPRLPVPSSTLEEVMQSARPNPFRTLQPPESICYSELAHGLFLYPPD